MSPIEKACLLNAAASIVAPAQRPRREIGRRIDAKGHEYFEMFVGAVGGNHGTPAPMRFSNGHPQWPKSINIRAESTWKTVSHVIRILGRNALAQCGINEAQPNADVELTNIFGVDSDGHIASKTRVTQLSVTPCNLTIANIDARPYIEQAVDPQINRLASTIDAQIWRIDLSGFFDYTRIY